MRKKLLTLFAIIALFYYKINSSLKYEKIPLILIIGGAIGNAIDRILVLIPVLIVTYKYLY